MLREKHMKNITQIVAVTATGLLLSTGLSLAAKENTCEAVMHKCNAQTLKQVPRGGHDWQQQRAAVWKDCMISNGQQP
jgi:hypothetical protein